MTKLVHFDVGNKFVEPFVARNIFFRLPYEECMWYITEWKGRKGDEILLKIRKLLEPAKNDGNLYLLLWLQYSHYDMNPFFLLL